MIVPALHRRYIASMVDMFGDSTLHCVRNLERASGHGAAPVDMENYYSRLGLDIIGKAVFNYDFDSLSKDDVVIEAVYTTLREAEHRSLCPIPYWKLPGATDLVPRQVRAVPSGDGRGGLRTDLGPTAVRCARKSCAHVWQLAVLWHRTSVRSFCSVCTLARLSLAVLSFSTGLFDLSKSVLAAGSCRGRTRRRCS